jgi:hypothetical protein
MKERNQKMKSKLGAVLLASGILATQAHASVSVPDRVAAVRAELNKRVAEAQALGGHEAVAKLPYTQMEVASWLNWVNWPNWNNWRDWNNWRNWSNWSNWFNF